VLLVLGTAIAWPEQARASFPGENGRLVFTWQVETKFADFLATVNDAGSDLDVVARCPHDCTQWFGDWSSNGRRLIYASRRCFGSCPWRLVVSRPDGSDQEPIFQVNGDRNVLISPAWSPTARRIAFVWVHFVQRLGRDVRDIYVIRRDGTHRRRITHSPGKLKTGLDWSVQNRLVFSQSFAQDSELFMIRPDGSRLQQLTHNSVPDTEPDWAPGGARLTFVRRLDEIWTMGTWGANRERVASPGAGSPAWAPDGSLIAYFSSVDNEIHTVQPSGQGDASLGSPVSGDEILQLDWQPR
jgi:Tol biopolymer transport system component